MRVFGLIGLMLIDVVMFPIRIVFYVLGTIVGWADLWLGEQMHWHRKAYEYYGWER